MPDSSAASTAQSLPPKTLSDLAGLVERSIRGDNDLGRDGDADLERIARSVANHAARYTLTYGWKLFCDNPENSRQTGIQRIANRALADIKGSTLGADLLKSLAMFASRKLIEWAASSRQNQVALVAIGAPLPYWDNDDNAPLPGPTLEPGGY